MRCYVCSECGYLVEEGRTHFIRGSRVDGLAHVIRGVDLTEPDAVPDPKQPELFEMKERD